MVLSETIKRSVVKSITFRVIAFLLSYFIIGWATNDWGIGNISLSLALNLIKTLAYFIYERFWDRVSWGKS